MSEDLRKRLGKAIKARDAAHDRHAEQFKAQSRARQLLDAAEERYAAASAALDAARIEASRRIASAARSGAAIAPSADLAAARAELAAAEDDLAAARSAYAECAVEGPDGEARQRVEDAVDAVLGELIEPLLQLTRDAQAKVLTCRLRLRFLEHCVDRLDHRKAREINAFLSAAWQLAELSPDIDKHAVNQSLRDVRARLMRDPNCELPQP
jgi:hypothetical protein